MSFLTIFLLIAVVTGDIVPTTFTPITTLDQIGDWSGYYKYLPIKTDTETYYAEKKALVIFTHGAEDAEVLYPIAFFKDRNIAELKVACDPHLFKHQANQPAVQILDLVKPTYTYPCDFSFEEVDLLHFDIVYVSGGAASSYPVRGNTILTGKLNQFAMEKGPEAVIGFICSGSEVILESGFVPYMPSTTGSPVSKYVFELNKVHYVNRPITTGKFPKGASLIVGNGPDASYDFFVKMTEMLYDVVETGHSADFDPIPLGFTKVNDMEHIPPMWDPNATPEALQPVDLGTKRIAFLVADGVDTHVTKAMSSLGENNFYSLCPRGVNKVVGHRVATPQYLISCAELEETNDLVTNEDTAFDALVVPGGWWHINNLRGDSRAIRTIRNHVEMGRPVIAIDGGLQILALADVIRGHVVSAHSAVKTDAMAAGALIDETDGYVVSKNIITVDTTMFADDQNKVVNKIMKDLVGMMEKTDVQPENTCTTDSGMESGILGVSIAILVITVISLVAGFAVIFLLRKSSNYSPLSH